MRDNAKKKNVMLHSYILIVPEQCINTLKSIKPVRQFQCPCCGYSFQSQDYNKEYNRFTNQVTLTEYCSKCGGIVETGA